MATVTITDQGPGPGTARLLPPSISVDAFPLGHSLPSQDVHAVSVSLPTWDNLVQYMANNSEVHDKLQCDYPRFYQHASVQRLNNAVLERNRGLSGYRCAIFPSSAGMERCAKYLRTKADSDGLQDVSILELFFAPPPDSVKSVLESRWARFCAVAYPENLTNVAAEAWGWFGDGISSRHADYLHEVFPLLDSAELATTPGTLPIVSAETDTRSETRTTVPEAPGERSDADTKDIVKILIAKWVSSGRPGQIEVDRRRDVFLYPKGMCAIGDIARRLVPTTCACASEVVVFGWPYGSIPKCVQKSGYERVTFYGQGTSEELDQLDSYLASGKTIAYFFCEVPSNPLCATPDLDRIRRLADR